MTRIVIHGCYGKMGQAVAAAAAASPDVEVVAGVDAGTATAKRSFPVFSDLGLLRRWRPTW